MKKLTTTIILLASLALNAFAQNTATAIVPGTPRSAELPAGGRQRYSVTISGNSLLTAYVEGEISTVMVLYNSAGRELATARRNENIVVDVTSGTYTIEITGRRDTTTGQYTLNVTTETAQAATARMAAKYITAPVILPWTTTGEVGLRQNEVKLYRLIAYPNVTQITAYTEGNDDTVIAVYNAVGGRIASDDDSGDDFNARVSINVTSGTYYIEVGGYGNSYTRYTLHITTETASASAAFKPYMDMVIARFLSDTAAVNRHEAVLQFITGRGNATRAEIETFYRNNIRALVSQVVDEEFNKVSFFIENIINSRANSYNGVLTRNPQTGQYTLRYEDARDITKELSGTSLEVLLASLTRSGEFSQAAINNVRAQAALIPAVARPGELERTKTAVTNFFLTPNNNNYNAMTGLYNTYVTQPYLRGSFLRSVEDLNPALAMRIIGR